MTANVFAIPEQVLDSMGADLTVLTRMRCGIEKESLRVTLNSIADGVIATDHDGRITFMNPVAESLTGWREREAEGAPVDTVLQLTDEEGRPTRTNPIAVALRGGDMCFLREDCFLLSRDGSRYEIQDSAAPVKTGDGEVKGAVMVFRDVSARRAMQKKAPLPRHP